MYQRVKYSLINRTG